MVGKTFFHVSRGRSERKNFRQFFFSKMFADFERKVSRPLEYFWSAGSSKQHFFCKRNFVTKNSFFASDWDNSENFLASDREFFAFLAKKVRRDFRISLFVSGRTFIEKFFFHKFSYFVNLFGHWGKIFQNFVLLCSAGPSKKQPMCPEVLCDEKQNVSVNGVFL